MTQQDAPKRNETRPTVSLGVWLAWLGIGVAATAAHIANYVGNRGLAEFLALVVMFSLTYALVTHLVQKTVREVRSKGGSPLGSASSVAAWNVLWTIPVILFVFGFFGDLLGFKEQGKLMGVIAVVTLLPILPTYLVLGIKRAIRKRRNAEA